MEFEVAQVLKVLLTQKYGAVVPSLHLQQLNPHIEEPGQEEQALFSTEHLQMEGLSTYFGMTAKSTWAPKRRLQQSSNLEGSLDRTARLPYTVFFQVA